MKDKYGNTLSKNQIVQKGTARIQNIFLEFDMFILHIVGCVPSHHIRRFFYRVAGMRIGKGSTLHMGARFYDSRNISIGEDSIIGEGAVLDGRERLQIGDHVDIASEVMIYNSQHDIHGGDFEPVSAPVVIEDYVFIGPRAIILPGVTLKRGAVVGAGAVVTRDVESFKIVAGVPAKEIGERRDKKLSYRLGRARWFR